MVQPAVSSFATVGSKLTACTGPRRPLLLHLGPQKRNWADACERAPSAYICLFASHAASVKLNTKSESATPRVSPSPFFAHFGHRCSPTIAILWRTSCPSCRPFCFFGRAHTIVTEPWVQEDGALSVDSCWSQSITDTSSNFVRKLATSPSALKFQVPARRALLVAFPCDAGRREFEAPLRLVEELVPTLSRLAKGPRRSLPWAGGEAAVAASAVAYCVPMRAVASMLQLRQGATEQVALSEECSARFPPPVSRGPFVLAPAR